MRSDGFGSAFARSVIFGTATTEVLIGLFGWYTGAFADVRWEGFLRALDEAGGVLLDGLGVGVPLALIGSLVLGWVGLPLTRWIGERFVALWMAPLSVAIGAAAGGSVFFALSGILMGGSDSVDAAGHEISESVLDWARLALLLGVGAVFGAPTGLWWWFLYRRVLLGKA